MKADCVNFPPRFSEDLVNFIKKERYEKDYIYTSSFIVNYIGRM